MGLEYKLLLVAYWVVFKYSPSDAYGVVLTATSRTVHDQCVLENCFSEVNIGDVY